MAKLQTFPVMEIPYEEFFPPIWAGYVKDIVNATGFDANYVIGAMLSATAGACGKRWRTDGNYRQFPAFYMVIVGLSGAGKTPVLKAMYNPVFDEAKRIHNEYQKLKKEKLKEIRAYESTPPKERDGEKPSLDDLPPNRKPLVQDITPERLAGIASGNGGYVTVLQNELSGLLDNTKRYQNNSEGFYLTGFDQTTYQHDRKNGDEFFTPEFCLNLIGTIQPELLTKLAEQQRGVSGMLYRFLYIFPQTYELDTNIYLTDQPNDGKAFEGYNNAIKKIFAEDIVYDVQNPLQVVSKPVGLCREAQETISAFLGEYRMQINASEKMTDEFLNDERGFIAKATVYTIRLALLYEVMTNIDHLGAMTVISAENAERACLTMQYLMQFNLQASLIAKGKTPAKSKGGAKVNDLLNLMEIGKEYPTQDVLTKANETLGVPQSTAYRYIEQLNNAGYLTRRYGKVSRIK